MTDLIAVVADKHMEFTLKALLEKRYRDLGICRIDFQIYSHPHHDGGVRTNGAQFLVPLRK